MVMIRIVKAHNPDEDQEEGMSRATLLCNVFCLDKCDVRNIDLSLILRGIKTRILRDRLSGPGVMYPLSMCVR